MGRRGPAPKPTRLKILNGNAGKRPLNKKEPQPKPGKPACPEWLSKDAKAEWKRIVPELLRLGLLTVIDRAALAGYCQAVAEVKLATEMLDQEGRMIETGGKPVVKADGTVKVYGATRRRHPAITSQRDALGRVRAFLAEFGLSPASRSRVSGKSAAKGQDDFSEFLSHGRKGNGA